MDNVYRECIERFVVVCAVCFYCDIVRTFRRLVRDVLDFVCVVAFCVLRLFLALFVVIVIVVIVYISHRMLYFYVNCVCSCCTFSNVSFASAFDNERARQVFSRTRR